MPVATFLTTVAVTTTVLFVYTSLHGRRQSSEVVNRVNAYTNMQ